eukprot:TRINITY_DN3037_c0_g1_i4.p2 TRINITY_DN3037_c0_g1~~TRINITY_DN3037_c0_g1_i4.p2  ORF type:complete len:126 (+),score=25.74 TRINITY_DN3037_c0_g1_i4:38-415(+)
MPRGGARSSPSPARRSSPPPATRSPPPARHAPAAAPAAAPAGGGFMRNVMSTALGVGIGHAVSHTLLGGNRHETQQAVDDARANTPTGCQFQLETFNKCLDKSSDPSQCQWMYDELMTCKNAKLA